MSFEDYQQIVVNAPDMDWREEQRRLWRATYPFTAFIIFLFIISMISNSERGMLLASLTLIGGIITFYILINISCEIIKNGQKYPAKILTRRVSNIDVTGKAEVYLPDGNIIRANYKHPSPHRDRTYSDKNYAWPQIGDVVTVYYWECKPQYAYLIWKQFKKTKGMALDVV